MLNATVFVSSVAMTKKGEWFTERENKAKKKPKEYAFLKFNSLVNKHNLTPGWIEQMREEALSELLFNAEIMNIRPRGITDGFYAQLNSGMHYYSYKLVVHFK
ncbi:hypothetical protein LEQ04_06680 [Riemerella anatipestifer]|uniref:hypothetical protein n=1 Tax=Riemerella anatipestifer TaxID=34085 RepID=UPI0021AA20F9|nr:hypothetical protein [Riemerella anatipestifer]WPC10466.1 hypothetical protein LEQ05_11150 [Riemerella anatipestifer]WPC13888.1 hypothetical protein LEQ03_04490 [Riemerella anatipestifer]WPC16427.1 hypothetical protein LEQ04_06680 [Riemerella anatipestifer]